MQGASVGNRNTKIKNTKSLPSESKSSSWGDC